MKKIDLIHTTILIIALLAGYSALEYVFYLLSSLANPGEVYHISSEFSARAMYYLIMIVLFSSACILLIKNARKYAGLMLKDEPEGSWEDTSKWDLDRRNILLVLIIGMGLYTLIQSIPYAVSYFYDVFSKKVSSDPLIQESTKKDPLLIELLRATIGAILIYAAPILTNFIDKTIAVRLDSPGSRS